MAHEVSWVHEGCTIDLTEADLVDGEFPETLEFSFFDRTVTLRRAAKPLRRSIRGYQYTAELEPFTIPPFKEVHHRHVFKVKALLRTPPKG